MCHPWCRTGRDLEHHHRFRAGLPQRPQRGGDRHLGQRASAPSDYDLTTGTRSGIADQPYRAVQDRYAADGTFGSYGRFWVTRPIRRRPLLLLR